MIFSKAIEEINRVALEFGNRSDQLNRGIFMHAAVEGETRREVDADAGSSSNREMRRSLVTGSSLEGDSAGSGDPGHRIFSLLM